MKGSSASVRTVDVHIGGDVHQVIVAGVKDLPGETVGEQMAHLRQSGDGLRQLLLLEPRGGHPSHFAGLVVRPCHPDAEAGFIIMEYMGYPLFSGSNTMATAIALLEDGRLPMADGKRTVILESPGGLVTVNATCRDGKVLDVSFRPDSTAYVAHTDLSVAVPGRGEVRFDVVWSGCFYALIDGPSHGFDLLREEEEAMGAFSYDFMEAVRDQGISFLHRELGDQGPASFVLWVAPSYRNAEGELERRISPVVHPRSVSRCPSGTGTTAAIAQMVEAGEMQQGDRLRTLSCWDTPFLGECYQVGPYGEVTGCRVEVTGTGWIISRKELVVNFDDPLTPAAGLEELLV